jgi:hypothetical protein
LTPPFFIAIIIIIVRRNFDLTVKLVLLKSGEDIIADVNEMYTEEQKLIGYLFKKPCSVKLRSFSPESDGKNGYQIGLSSWIPLTQDDIVPVPLEWVVTMVNPIERLLQMYENDVVDKKENDKNSDSN